MKRFLVLVFNLLCACLVWGGITGAIIVTLSILCVVSAELRNALFITVACAGLGSLGLNQNWKC